MITPGVPFSRGDLSSIHINTSPMPGLRNDSIRPAAITYVIMPMELPFHPVRRDVSPRS